MQASPNDPRKEKARPSSSQRWQPPVTDYGVTVYPGGSKPFFYHASLKYLFFVSSPPDLKWAVKTNAFIGKFNGQTFHCCREPSGNLLTPPRLRTTGLSNSFALRRKAVAAHTHQSPAREGCGCPHIVGRVRVERTAGRERDVLGAVAGRARFRLDSIAACTLPRP